MHPLFLGYSRHAPSNIFSGKPELIPGLPDVHNDEQFAKCCHVKLRLGLKKS
jgi:hypothetical protein